MKKLLHFATAAFAAAWMATTAAAQTAHSVWVEGEDAFEKNVKPHNWYDSVKRGEFSNRAYISHYDNNVTGSAKYRFEIPADGDYTLWMRINHVGGPAYEIAFNGGEAVKLLLNDVRDQVNVADNDAPDMRFLGWVRSGPHALKKGENTMAVTFGGGGIKSGYLDCFLLTTGRFNPAGARKPAGAGGELPANPGSWAFDPPDDPYTQDALFDLRPLLCGVAGDKGWIKATPDGGFARGDGSLIRFWAANDNVAHRPMDELEEHVRFLAKRGVNMVRTHSNINPQRGKLLTETNLHEVDVVHKMVATAKKQGIYTTFSPFWAVAACEPQHNLYGRTDGNLLGMLFWDKTMQAAYKQWLTDFFTIPNPYDVKKTPLKDDPALGIFQIQNEDSMLFWTMQGVQLEAKRRTEWEALEDIFMQWLADNKLPVATRLDYQFWNMDGGRPAGTGNPTESHKLSMRFAAEKMREFNTEVQRFIREDIKCPVLINAGNWQVASPARLLDHERWSYDVNQVQGVNRYFGGEHLPRDANDHTTGYLVAKGQYFTSISAVRDSWRALPIAIKQVKGKPFIVSESTWVSPNLYQSEGPFMIAAYSLLTGMGPYYWFALGQPCYDSTINKWQSANPAIMGGFPAAAWIYHKGYVKKGTPAVDEKRALAGDMWELKTPVITEDSSYDPNRPGTQTAENNIEGGAPFGAYFIGPVLVEYGADPKQTKIDLAGQKPDDLNKGVIKSNTGELFLNAPQGYCLLNAPKAQGVTGFLGEVGSFKTADFEIVSANEYATVLAVSLDDLPLSQSGKILLQVTTLCRPYGWSDSPARHNGKDMLRINDTGTSPWSVANTSVSVTLLNNTKIRTATLADINFYPAGNIPIARMGGKPVINLPKNAMYVVLQ